MNTARRKKFLKYISFKWELILLISLTLRKTPYGFLQTEFNCFTNITILIAFFCHPHFLTIVLWMLPTQCSMNPSLSGWTRNGCIPGYVSSSTRYRPLAISTGLCRLAPLGSGSCLPCRHTVPHLLTWVTSIYSVSRVPRAKFPSLYSSESQPSWCPNPLIQFLMLWRPQPQN